MPRDKVEVARRATDAYNRRDVDTLFAELATPDFEWWPALTSAYEGGCYRGRDGRCSGCEAEVWEHTTRVLRRGFERVGETRRDRSDGRRLATVRAQARWTATWSPRSPSRAVPGGRHRACRTRLRRGSATRGPLDGHAR